MSFVSFESFHQEILYKLFSVLVSSVSHPQNEMSLKKRASFNNLSVKPLWAPLGGMAELLQPFLALSHPILLPRSHDLHCMVKATVEFCERGRQHHCENQQIELSGESCIQVVLTASQTMRCTDIYF